MARKRGQRKGFLYKKGPSWILRWREDVRTASGELHRGRFSRTIGPASGPDKLTRKEAERQAWSARSLRTSEVNMMNSGHQLDTARCEQSATISKRLPPEQEVASSNLAGRTSSQSVTLFNSERSIDQRALSSQKSFHSGHQLATKPKALDLFCGAGGASMGLHRAGFEVTGVDHKPQPRYPFRFVQADALTFLLEGFDFIWASPPCQAFTALRFMPTAKEHPNLIPETRARLVASGIPYSIENVEGAPLGESGYLIMLCGTMFGLQTGDGRAELRRHRLFETSFSIPLRPRCQHGYVSVLTVTGHTPVDNRGRDTIAVAGGGPKGGKRTITVTGSTAQANLVRNVVRQTFSARDAREAMGIDWMNRDSLSQAIPPAYAEFIGREALAFITSRSTELTAAAIPQPRSGEITRIQQQKQV